MGFRIQNNIAAMNAQRNLGISDAAMSKSLERLSSGYRINSAKDDAAGLSISQGFRASIASYNVASRNVTEGNALLQVAEGAMDQVGNMLTRLKELATQAASANAGSNLDKINAEGNQLILEIDRIANSTEYAGSKLVDGSFGVSDTKTGSWTLASAGLQSVSGLQSSVTYTVAAVTQADGSYNITASATLAGGRVSQTVYGVSGAAAGATAEVSFAALGLKVTINENFTATSSGGTIIASAAAASDFQVGARDTSNDRIGVTLSSIKTSSLDAGLAADQLNTAAKAQAFLTAIDSAINKLNEYRGNVGAAQNRLGYAAANLATTIENYTAADSVIRDVDMAAEMTSFTKNQILLQAGTAMLSQANQAPQMIMSLFK
jgi:flagellin